MHSFIRGMTGRKQIFVCKLYTFFVGCNGLVMQRLTDRRVINAVCEPSFSVCTLHLSRVQRLLKNAPMTRDASPPLVVALCALLQVKFVKHIAAAAKLVDDEEHVADIHVDATLQGGVELEVGTETLDVAVEGQTNEFAFGVEHTRTRVATSDVVD